MMLCWTIILGVDALVTWLFYVGYMTDMIVVKPDYIPAIVYLLIHDAPHQFNRQSVSPLFQQAVKLWFIASSVSIKCHLKMLQHFI